MRAVLLIGCVLTLCVTAAAQRRQPASAPTLPPVSMTCPIHPEVVEARPGSCPMCQRVLVPVRLDAAWMCPVHAAVVEPDAGTCRICRRDLIRVTVSLTWTCRGDSGEHLEPGLCGDGSPRIGRRTLRPHGNHNPKHGGQFFMAPDNWHHLEGAYPQDGVFRVYVYDDYARPLPPQDLRRVAARAVTMETYDPATRETTEVRAFPLRASRDGTYLETRVDAGTLPREITAKLRLPGSGSEYRFDFTFTELTREPSAPAPASRGRTAAPPPAAAATAPTATLPVPPAAADAGPAPDPPLTVLPIPASMDEMLAQMGMRVRHVRELIDRGDLEAVYVPAFQAKDLAVALEPHLAHLAAPRRDVAGPALERVVRTAWLLDAFGDVGNRQQVGAAYDAFAAAVNDVLAAFEAAP